MKYLIVFIGGGFGSALRYLIHQFFIQSDKTIPYATLIVNVVGSLLIGVLLGLSLKNNYLSQNQTLLLATGFCGGFTTFSTFAFENSLFLKNADYFNFIGYIIITVALTILAVFLGMFLVK